MTALTGDVTPDADKRRQLTAIARSGYGRPYRIYQPRNLAFWVYWLIMAAGVVRLLQNLVPGAPVLTTALVSGVVVFTLYTVPFWLIISHVDRFRSVPVKVRVLAFLWGGIGATFGMVIAANDPIRAIYTKVYGQAFALDWSAALTAPFTEEIAKGAGFVLILLLAPRVVRTAFDGAVVGAFIGLGFQVFEDLLYAVSAAAGAFGAEQGPAVVQVIVMRAATGIASHTVFSAIFCMGLVWLIGRSDEPRRVGRGLVLVLGAMLMHGAWDSAAALAHGTFIGVLAVWILVPIVMFTLLVVGLRRAAVPERAWVRAILTPEVDRGVLTGPELAAVSGTGRERKAFVKAAGDHAGRRRARHVLTAAGELAEQIAEDGGRETPATDFARSEVARLR
ncbi:PrsW family intramembrane metalloprotease [Rhodococcus kronopolitis]|uniref:PrsW family intramembrane metalloprotease n=1 Tax=Rhodococcus kronopolitis TaxID=1460226 RepID=A0ABV9FRE2_9NOCA